MPDPVDSPPAAAAPPTDPNWKRTTGVFLGSQTVSLLGTGLVQYAIIWHITLKSQSGVAMTAATVCGSLPMFFMAPLGGAWADRYDRRKLIVLADGFIAAVTLGIALYYLAGNEGIWPLLVASVVRSIGSGVQMPAVSAVLPQMVPAASLTRVNAINSTIQSTTMLVTPMASGALMTFAPLAAIFFIDVVTAALAIGMLLLFVRVPPPVPRAAGDNAGAFADMLEGLRYVRGQPWLRSFFLFVGIFCVMAAPVAFLSPLQVTRTFGADVWRLTAMELAFFIGMTAGGVLMGTWKGVGNRVRTMAFATAVLGTMTLALGVVVAFPMYLVAMGIAGVAMPVFNIPSTVMLQERSDPAFMGRVFGVMGMLGSLGMPVGMVVFGPLADVMAIEWLLGGTGVVMVVQAVALARNRVLLPMGEPLPPAAPPPAEGAASPA